MSAVPFITREEVEHKLHWQGVSEAIFAGHQKPRADIDDILFKHGDNALLNRAAWIQGAGIGIKTATIFPINSRRTPELPTVHSVFTLFSDDTGVPEALIDGNLVTRWKTAGDSITGTKLLARKDSRNFLIVGAGSVAESMIDAVREMLPQIEDICIWNRTADKAQKLARKKDIRAVGNLQQAVGAADIISCATMSTDPVIKGAWVKPGTHIDLIGAYRPDMREADDDLIAKGSLFVDARETTIHDIGELIIPMREGVITEDDVKGDLYDLCSGGDGRLSDDDITIFKNGGGAHLDVMTALYIKGVVSNEPQ